MIRRLLLGVLTGGYFFLVGCGEPAVTRVIDVADCSALRAQGAFKLALRPTDSVYIELKGASRVVDAAEIEVADGVVSIISSPSSELAVQVSCPDLRRLELIGAVRVEQMASNRPARYEKIGVYGDSEFAAQKLVAINLDLRGSGSAQIAIQGLVAEKIQLLLSGASQTVIEGETTELVVQVTGKAALAAQGLPAQTVKVNAAGNSRSAILATAHLTANLRDTAHLSYAGTPDLVIDVSEQATLEQVSR